MEFGSVPLRWSLFGHLFARNDELCGYHALRLKTHYFPRIFQPWLQQIDGHTIDALRALVPSNLQDGFFECVSALADDAIIVPVSYDENTYIERIRSMFFKDVGNVHVLVLHLAGFCNLRCSYCFIDGGKIPGGNFTLMTEGTAYAAIDRFLATLSRKPAHAYHATPSIVFYGGEPLLNKKVLAACLTYLQERLSMLSLPYEVDKVLITNGTLIDADTARLLKSHDVSVSLSIDGPKRIHDRHRMTRRQLGSFDAVMKGYDNLLRAGLRPSVACVLAPDSVAYVDDIIRFFVETLRIKAIGMNHVSILPENGYGYDENYEHCFTEAVIAGQELILQYGDVYERRMSRKLNSFLEGGITKADCTGCGEQVAVTPTGDIQICQGYVGHPERHNVGSVFDTSIDIDRTDSVLEWARRSPLLMTACHACIALGTCGGGCPRNAETLHGSIWQVDSAFCHFARRAAEWLVWKKRDGMLGRASPNTLVAAEVIELPTHALRS